MYQANTCISNKQFHIQYVVNSKLKSASVVGMYDMKLENNLCKLLKHTLLCCYQQAITMALTAALNNYLIQWNTLLLWFSIRICMSVQSSTDP